MANEDPAYLRWVRLQNCCVCARPPPSEAHHMCGAGMALRSHDHTTVPLCSKHHAEHHEFRGHFGDMNRHQRREWQTEMAWKYRDKYRRDHDGSGG